MRALGRALARLFVWLRHIVVLGWIAGAVWMTFSLPAISGRSASSFAALVPPHAPAITAEQASAHYFAFPVISRTMIVVRNPRGLSAQRQAQIASLAVRLDRHELPAFAQVAGAIPLLNTLHALPFSRGTQGTTGVVYLFFHPGLNSATETAIARRLIRDQLGRRPGEFEGVTGAVPAEGAQTETVNNRMLWVELATIALVALIIALRFRALGAASLAVCAVAISYLVANRVVEQLGRASGLNIPAEAQPVLVVLVFGIVTDYSIFFLSRFRNLLAAGETRHEAARRVMRETAPIVAVAGVTVALGTAGLLVSTMGYLRAFGPGLAVAVMVAMLVAVSFGPAVLAIGGRWVFWPSAHASAPVSEAPPAPSNVRIRRSLGVRLAVRHPVLATIAVLALIGGAASGLSRIAIGNELVGGLPSGSPIHRSYRMAQSGFAPGVLDPVLVLVTGTSVGYERGGLDRLQRLIVHQPDIAGVLGPRQLPLDRPHGVTVARSGTAARYLVFLGSDPLGARAIAAVNHLRSHLPRLIAQARLPLARAQVGGDTAISADIVAGTVSSLERVLPAVLALVFLVIALYLRALVAPLYLVATSALAVVAALGLTVWVLQILLGYQEITYYVLFTVAVLLVSLGSDYNVFVVGRIWQEARLRPLREAVELGGSRAARPITTAGFVLALSFGLLAVIPLRAFLEIAFAMGLGLLIDAFIVRTVLVPALLTLVGPRSAWPGHALRQAPAGAVAADPREHATRRLLGET